VVGLVVTFWIGHGEDGDGEETRQALVGYKSCGLFGDKVSGPLGNGWKRGQYANYDKL
jgi:hypothetical protein